MHPLLRRQLRRVFGATRPDDAAWRRWLPVIDQHYHDNDADRALLERSLELTSQELLEKNRQLAHENTRLHAEIRQREAAEARLRQAQKLEAIGQLAGGVAHDVNNQLCAILGFAAFAERELPADHPVQECLRHVIDAGERCASTARRLLAFGRKQVLEPQVLDPHAVITRTERLLSRLVREDVRIVLARSGAPVYARLDPSQLEQVIVNLAINARDAMPGGGELTLETRGARLDAGAVADRPDARAGRYACVTVRDTGHGMDAATLARVFEPFFTTKPEGEGTGLGLAMVHGFVHQSEGFVEVESQPGAGTAFHLYFPACEAPPATDGVRRAAESALPRGTATVLLAEDEPLVRAMAERVLAACGYRVHAAADGQAALALVAEGLRPDLLLSDLVMPGVGGLDLAARLRPRHPDLRICFLSGYPPDDSRARLAAQGGHRFLAKPFTPEQLATAVHQALHAASPAPAGAGE